MPFALFSFDRMQYNLNSKFSSSSAVLPPPSARHSFSIEQSCNPASFVKLTVRRNIFFCQFLHASRRHSRIFLPPSFSKRRWEHGRSGPAPVCAQAHPSTALMHGSHVFSFPRCFCACMKSAEKRHDLVSLKPRFLCILLRGFHIPHQTSWKHLVTRRLPLDASRFC